MLNTDLTIIVKKRKVIQYYYEFSYAPQTILLYKYFIFLILFNISIQRLLSTQRG